MGPTSVIKTVNDLDNELDDVVNDVLYKRMLHPDGAKLIIDIVEKYRRENIISNGDIRRAYRRADRGEGNDGRSLLELFLNTKRSYTDEKVVSDLLISILTSRGEVVEIKEYGNSDHGHVRFINLESCPDILLIRNGISCPMDIKCLNQQFFKFRDIEDYVYKYKSGIIVKSDDKIYVYPRDVVFKMLKHFEGKPQNYWRRKIKYGWKEGFDIGNGISDYEKNIDYSFQLQIMIDLNKIEVYDIP